MSKYNQGFTEHDWIKPSKQKRSKVWEHYLENRIDKYLAKCIHCVPGPGTDGIFKCTNNQTTGLLYHLAHIHGIKIQVAKSTKNKFLPPQPYWNT